MTNNIEKQLLNALEGVREDLSERKKKQDAKNWSAISVPLTLKDALTRMTKDELSTIRKQLDIKGASQLKKGELVDLLQTQIPDSLDRLLPRFDEERYGFIMSLLHNDGYITESNLQEHQIEYFRARGILFTGTHQGQKIIALPEEIGHQFQVRGDTFKQQYHRNSEWIKLTQGLLYYYGTLTIKELLNLLHQYLKKDIHLSDYLSIIHDAREYYQQILIDNIGFSDTRVVDPENVKREQNMRVGVAFYPFSKEQLLQAGEPGFEERSIHYQNFVDFITHHYEVKREVADSIVEYCVYATRRGESPNTIMKFLETRLEFASLEILSACMEKVVKLMNHTRQWELKGHTPKELLPREKTGLQSLPGGKVANKKIGRNAPCPCGSNKKYKHCCGR